MKLKPHRAGVECDDQPEALTEALWDWTEDPNGHEFIEFLTARGLKVVPMTDEERRAARQ